MNQILIVEDDSALGRGLALAFSDASHIATLVTNCADAKKALSANLFHLAIFDIGLPDGSGLDLLTEVRQSSNMPIILLTANDLETDIVTGLALGADDYITKPFSLAVLRARVQARLRHAQLSASTYEQGIFCFDFERFVFTAAEKTLFLSQTEQKLLKLLIDNRNSILPRETLIDRIWTDGLDYVDENALSVTINRLRNKLGKDAPIKTIYGIGYSWTVDL